MVFGGFRQFELEDSLSKLKTLSTKWEILYPSDLKMPFRNLSFRYLAFLTGIHYLWGRLGTYSAPLDGALAG